MTEQPVSLAIEQINLGYDMWQDRMVLRLRTRDSTLIDLHLTRRLTKYLLPALVELVGGTVLAPDSAIRQELLAYEHQESVSASNFAQPFNEEGFALFDGTPILVSEVKLHPHDGTLGWTLEFVEQEGRAMKLNADKNMLHNIIKLFNNVLPSTGWDLPAGQVEGAMVSVGHTTH
jgi:hypothetical protein